MGVDSAVTKTFTSVDNPAKIWREYETDRKAYSFPGVGCVATWGVRDHNRIAKYLHEQQISSKTHTVDDLAELTYLYLTEEYRPKDLEYDDIGYHVAGFDKERRPRLYHIFWGFDRPKPLSQKERHYAKNIHHPLGEIGPFVYNGRNDLAETMVHTLIRQAQAGYALRFKLENSVDRVNFVDFVLRFAAEITPEVGPPFHIYLISPDNRIESISNMSFCKINDEDIRDSLEKMGLH